MVAVAGAVAALVVIGVAVMAAAAGTSAPGSPTAEATRSTFPGSVLADGWYRIVPSHVADRDLCLGEGRERNRRTDRELAVQRSCQGLSPDTYVAAVGRDVYQIEWHHPVQGVGCLTVDQPSDGKPAKSGAPVYGEALVGPSNCTRAANQRFLLEPADARVSGGFTVRPVHSGMCLGVLGGVADVDVGAELVQHNCTGGADQVFLFVPASAPAQGGRASAP
ncbi:MULTISPECIES: RICIN domain-containing protein [Streptosporangium]|uniref:Ricin B lectin domain-containing protein n=1 Tax=Streptosporangium brasiliense TaxID=47480 RepID=A0ABT9R9C6_9ACTN|nr:RICIN domain-containing protein [Streptosporangium brasiliense]MDP9865845.1 hypothetical protein [Streptosporangium brasiliense]